MSDSGGWRNVAYWQSKKVVFDVEDETRRKNCRKFLHSIGAVRVLWILSYFVRPFTCLSCWFFPLSPILCAPLPVFLVGSFLHLAPHFSSLPLFITLDSAADIGRVFKRACN